MCHHLLLAYRAPWEASICFFLSSDWSLVLVTLQIEKDRKMPKGKGRKKAEEEEEDSNLNQRNRILLKWRLERLIFIQLARLCLDSSTTDMICKEPKINFA